MPADAISVLEYESMVFSRHLAGIAGRTRRRGGVLDQSAYTLLSLLQAGGPTSVAELAAITGLDTSTLTRQTAALQRSGLADRIPDPDGGKARKLRVTDLGARLVDEERQASRTALDNLTTDWPETDRATLAALLSRLNKAIESHSGRDPWPRCDGD